MKNAKTPQPLNSRISIWKFTVFALQQKIPVVLLYVLESKGSSPGRQGFFMAVNANGDMEGSIGGGIMEHKFVEMTREKLKVQSTGHSVPGASIRKQVHDKVAAKNQSGMICSGEQTILLYLVNENDGDAIHRMMDSLAQHKNGTFVLSPAGIQFEDSEPQKDYEYFFQSENDWFYKEKTGYKNQLFIIGGGHCSLALCRLMQTMDFYIRVYDDRQDLKTMLLNEAAHEKHFVYDYSELGQIIPAGNSHYVIIMTIGYRTDDIALQALAGKQFAYLGLLGSKFKTAKIIAEYKAKGINEFWLQQIHAPIGLTIKSQTPEEIAVSIAAEIISIKNKSL